jgi:hypothetical protein
MFTPTERSKGMNDNEIVKALECCNNPPGKADCRTCPFYHSEGRCTENMLSNALDLINRLQAEIERLKTVHYCIDKVILGKQEFAIADEYLIAYQNALERLYNNINLKSEARKEFAERIKSKLRDLAKIEHRGEYCYLIGEAFFDNLLEEMDGKEKENA